MVLYIGGDYLEHGYEEALRVVAYFQDVKSFLSVILQSLGNISVGGSVAQYAPQFYCHTTLGFSCYLLRQGARRFLLKKVHELVAFALVKNHTAPPPTTR